ncbi:pentatricopeptide repeat-containing protein At2g27610-like [Nicotiana tabacum]|uniref:Pentatricopeptide repeat-containing protein At2g27610-like n=2 Tax=Nicotiana TaxID=4085 RepID=A0A1S3XB00_TOBAC|nr:PREDICTED: pentatricopeptide repeat-containing protein At4g39530-like [Nicotiana sylvestris]
MIIRSPAFHLCYNIARQAKLANQIYYQVITTHSYLVKYPENNTNPSFKDKYYDSNNVNLDVLPLLHQNGFLCDQFSLNKIISTCAKLGLFTVGIQTHCQIIKIGFDSNVFINTALVDMYGKCGVIKLAQKLFDEMPERNVVTWNALISGYLDIHYPENAVAMFLEMLREGISPTPSSVSAVLVGCTQLEACELGAQLHALIWKAGFALNLVVDTVLIDMYSKCLDLETSRRVFDQMPERNVITWTSMITGYAQKQCPFQALTLFKEMLKLGIRPNYVTYSSLLNSFSCPDYLVHCEQVHCHVIQQGFNTNHYLVVTLLSVYSECSCSLEDFQKLCSDTMKWDEISWNAVIAGFSNLAVGGQAFACFARMRRAGFTADHYTFASILKAIGNISGLGEGMQTHCLALKTGYTFEVFIQNGLLSMYTRCGRLEEAERIFSSMEERDLISWNSLLTGCAHHGYGRDVMVMFEEMRRCGIKPDLTTFLAVLSACRHAGLLDEGIKYFDLMKNDNSLPPPKLEHYACIVDLYGRAGHLLEAEAFINNMPIEPGPSVFKSLLSACQLHGNKELAIISSKKLVELCPNDPATYILLANVLASEGNWNDAEGQRKLMLDRGLSKKPGYSWL